MTEKMKTTAPVSSVGADGAQPQLKNYNEIIANETAQINLQAAQNPEKSGSGGPIMWQWGFRCGIILSERVRCCILHWKMIMQGFSGGSPVCSVWNVRITCTLRHRQRP